VVGTGAGGGGGGGGAGAGAGGGGGGGGGGGFGVVGQPLPTLSQHMALLLRDHVLSSPVQPSVVVGNGAGSGAVVVIVVLGCSKSHKRGINNRPKGIKIQQ